MARATFEHNRNPPAAIAVHLILEGKLNLTGVEMPLRPEIYEPIPTRLNKNWSPKIA